MTDQNQQQRLRVALVQMCSGRSVADNLQQADRLIREAAAKGAHYIQTPETTAHMELDPELARLEAQQFDASSVLAMFRSLARELNVCLHIGSVTIRPAGKNRLLNRSCLISPTGGLVAHYDKIHLFDVDLPKGESHRESDLYEPGSKAVLAPVPLALPFAPRLGFSICYDLRFPALYRVLAKAGAQILTAPSAFTRQTGEKHWHVLLRARAIENGCFVLAAAQGGDHENGRATYGHSLIVSPSGEILAEADTEPQIVVADLDLAQVDEARSQIPSLRHDRPFEIMDLAPDRLPEGAT